MNDTTLIQQQFSLSVYEEAGSFSVNAATFEGLFDAIARRSQQLATYAASRNALSAPEHTVGPELAKVSTAPLSASGEDASGGNKGRPARKAKAGSSEPAGPVGDADTNGGKGGNGDAEEGVPEPAPSSVTYDDVRDAVVKLAGSKGRDAAIGVLDTFGVGHAKDLTEAQWPEAQAALTDALEG